MFKHFVSTLCIVLFAMTGSSNAQSNTFSIGAIVGEPTGITAKLWMDDRTAIQGSAAWSFRKERAIHLHSDIIMHHNISNRVESGTLHLYYGIGGRIKDTADTRVGARVPLGLNYRFEDTPLTFFIEVAPVLDIAPATEMDANASLGLRLKL